LGLLKSVKNIRKTNKIKLYQKLGRHRDAFTEYKSDEKLKSDKILEVEMKK
jgi:hypothetical protein